VFLGMARGLSDDQMAKESVLAGEPVQPKRIAWIRETVRMTSTGKPPYSNPSYSSDLDGGVWV
jgi:hypothetical protein